MNERIVKLYNILLKRSGTVTISKQMCHNYVVQSSLLRGR